MTFVDHFLVCGLDPSVGLEVEEDRVNPLERSYTPKILTKLPDITHWSNFNPEAITRLTLPDGLKFCTDKEFEQLSTPKVHSFLLTKEDGDRSHGISLIYYERVQDLNICHAMYTLQKMYSTECGSGLTSNLGTASRKSSRQEERKTSRSNTKMNSERSRSLPRHYQQLSRLTGSTIDLSTASYDYRQDTLYVTKSLSIISSQPFVSLGTQVLEAIHKYINKCDFDTQVLQGIIFNLLYDIPIPRPGRSVRFWCLGEALTLTVPKLPQELPLFDYNLLDFFHILENQILVYSSDYSKLMLVCESVTSLMYPFQWQHVYVPILPPSLENFLDAPVPYVMGLLRRTHDVELHKSSVCTVDIDNGELELPEELPHFPYENELISEIQDCIMQYGGKNGALILKEHALEVRENLESSNV